jgi:DhnA family fructose-bisphosphate aldolase class Ia
MAVNAGKARRMRRLVDEAGRTVILPLDLIVPVGLMPGTEDTAKLIDMGCEAGVNAVILRWGEAKRYAERLSPGTGLIIRISGATGLHDEPPAEVLLNSIDASIMIGGDAVCVDVALGGEREPASLQELAGVCELAERLGVVVIAEVHVPERAGPVTASRPQALAWAARTAQEMGADLVKVAHPGSAADVRIICEQTQIPVITAGGDLQDPLSVLRAAHEAISGGAAGTAIGRNVAGHEAPLQMQAAIIDLVRGRVSLDEISQRLLRPAGV